MINVANHILNISPEGELHTDEQVASAHSADRAVSNIDQLDRLVNSITSNIDEIERIVLFVHGGLVDEASLVKRVSATLEEIPENVYPIFINWRSGLFDTYGYQLFKVRNGELSSWAKLNWPIYLLTDVFGVFLNAPKSWLESGAHAYDTGIQRQLTSIDKALASFAERYGFVNVIKNGAIPSKTLEFFKWAVASPLKLISTPFVYVIGKHAWDEMLRRSNKVIYPGAKERDLLARDARENVSRREDMYDEGKLGRLLDRIDGITRENSKIDVDIIGHSMGAIIANKMLRAHVDFKFNNIVHMASADSVDTLFSSILPYLRNHVYAKYYSLHLHPQNEYAEKNAFGAAPSGSLLVYIEDMYTSPDSIMSRRSGMWDNISRVFDRIPHASFQNRLFFTVYGVDKKSLHKNSRDRDSRIVHPQKHGDFSRTKFWVPAAWVGSLQKDV